MLKKSFNFSKTTDLKTDGAQAHMGSNLALSAIFIPINTAIFTHFSSALGYSLRKDKWLSFLSNNP